MVHSSTSSLADDYYNYTADDFPSSDDPADAYYLPQHERDHPAPPQHHQPYAIPQSQTTVKKQASLAQIAVPSFSAFRSQVSSIPAPRTANRHSLAFQPSPRLAEPASRPFSVDSPLPQQPNGLADVYSPPLTEGSVGKVEYRTSYAPARPAHERNTSIDSRLAGTGDESPPRYSRRSSIPVPTRYAHDLDRGHAPKTSVSSTQSGSAYSPTKEQSNRTSMPGHKPAPSMTLQLDGVQRTLSDESLTSTGSEKRPKSPSRLGAFFGWKSSSPQKSGTESPTTTFSDRSLSPAPSPGLQKPLPMEHHGARLTPPGLDIHKANEHSSAYWDQTGTPIVLNSPEGNAHVQELERELAQVSTELAGSIRREMELEDELERMKLDLPSIPVSENGRRSSDYFSDSGASSTRYPVSDVDAKLDETERLRRKAEQEKAQMKAENAQRLQAELTRKRELEIMVQELEEQLHDKNQLAEEKMYLEERVGELESGWDEAKRRLAEEKKAKNNFEDLYSATREELEQGRNERDNLRDEIMPALKLRVEGLEAQASNTQALLYENSKMQQELTALREAHRGGTSMFNSIAEEDGSITSPLVGPRAGLSRSGSLARSSSKRATSLTRSGSVKDRDGTARRRESISGAHVTVEGLKEIEDQRDALHKALKLLISRYDRQQREHERAVRKLTNEKLAAEKSAASAGPKRSQYQREVSFLKDEVSMLRKRTEDALEQKWEYEKGLSGIKMDLDRAEQETRGLRSLLREHDIRAPSPRTLLGDQRDSMGSDRSKSSEPHLTAAETERDQARQVAESYRQRALELQEASSTDSESQSPAVTQLFDSANRMDELAEQLEEHVQADNDLRARLTQAIEKGEHDQKLSTKQIEEMQKRLAGLEDSVLAAQQHSETTLSTHESEVRRIDEAESPQLQRLRISIPEPNKLSPASSPLLRMSPRVSKKLSQTSLLEASKTQLLERKVRELERLLREAEEDMQQVVQRVNKSQFEVAELTGERDAAMVQMRKLQALIVEEREKADNVL